MLRKILTMLAGALMFFSASAFNASDIPADLPDSIFVAMKDGHVQGIALDREKGFLYLSFTSSFLKTDLQGNLIGSINRIQGHLGAMTLGPDGRVYASLECKDDSIGQGVASRLGIENLSHEQSVFYVAIIDVDKIDRIGIDPEKDGVMTTVCVREACKDYQDSKYGCSGIDGITFAPAFGKKGGKMYLYVGYGIYGDNDHTDNDNQILLRYDVCGWKRFESPVVFGTVPTNGPAKPQKKYFIHTGNTNWGIQNLAWDAFTGRMYMAVYKGKKANYPNYDLFSLNVAQKAFKAVPKGLDEKHLCLTLDKAGLHDAASDTWGWMFKWGSTGLCPLGGGLWYISENGKDKVTRIQSCNARLYRWTEDPVCPFVPARQE